MLFLVDWFFFIVDDEVCLVVGFVFGGGEVSDCFFGKIFQVLMKNNVDSFKFCFQYVFCFYDEFNEVK